MVRTYAYNPSCQGNFFGSSSTPSLNLAHRPAQEIQLSDIEVVPIRQQTPPQERCTCPAASQPFYTPFHSPYVDPVGSIIGLRVLYHEGRLCYVPVEPQLNYLINQQFNSGPCPRHMGKRCIAAADDFTYISQNDSVKENRMGMRDHSNAPSKSYQGAFGQKKPLPRRF
ncbi:hypothetical protein OESDEN_00221 [Oesophagostomum dentatum]|uniref:Uncharacterized protein n=1 Tax=Oesophagostomum dentatum TaxID=61180 RepID=A0A0B1TUG3_OESDE|nr:hypothetical protein OESDEN_00221 [Oesophagostomum dentatum]